MKTQTYSDGVEFHVSPQTHIYYFRMSKSKCEIVAALKSFEDFDKSRVKALKTCCGQWEDCYPKELFDEHIKNGLKWGTAIEKNMQQQAKS